MGQGRERETERQRDRETERETSLGDLLPPVFTLTRDLTHTPGICLDWKLNLQSFGVQDDGPTN